MTRPWVLALLVAAGVAVAIQNYVYFRPADSASSTSPETEAESQEILAELPDSETTVAAPLSRERLVAYLAELPGDFRNPFLSQAEARQLASDGGARASGLPVLSGILWSPERRMAWLDDEPVAENETTGGLRIEEIRPDLVVLSPGGAERVVLRLPERRFEAGPAADAEGGEEPTAAEGEEPDALE